MIPFLFVKVLDVCALGSCSRFWRELCGSDCVWEFLTRERWPLLTFPNNSSSSDPVIKVRSFLYWDQFILALIAFCVLVM